MVSLRMSLVLSVVLEHTAMKSSAMYCIVQFPVGRQGVGFISPFDVYLGHLILAFQLSVI